jgi:hypothetical protein
VETNLENGFRLTVCVVSARSVGAPVVPLLEGRRGERRLTTGQEPHWSLFVERGLFNELATKLVYFFLASCKSYVECWYQLVVIM